ncbi:MAG: ferritin-like domain-containing protein [Solirubrobacteraceae bacterium]
MSAADADGVAPTRRELLRTGVTTGVGAAVGASAALLAGPGAALLAGPGVALAAASGDAPFSVTDRLQRLIRLELLQIYCYRRILGSGLLAPHEHRTLAPFLDHELAHRDALARQLAAHGGGMPAGPTSDRQANHYLGHRGIGGRLGQLRGDLDAIRLLLTLEQVTIGAYFVALTKLQDPGLIVLCAQIMGAEAQHDAICALLLPPHKLGSAAPYGLVQGLQ